MRFEEVFITQHVHFHLSPCFEIHSLSEGYFGLSFPVYFASLRLQSQVFYYAKESRCGVFIHINFNLTIFPISVCFHTHHPNAPLSS